jgi:CBS domain containing-hemolysin-like protein
VIVPLLVLVLGLGLAGAAATVGVAAAAVSQLELTRWVSHRLRGVAEAARLLENPGHVLAVANALTTLGIVCAALGIPALLAETTATFLGVFTLTAGVPLFVSAVYLVPRVVGRRWAEPIVEHAVPWLDGVGRALAPLIPQRDASPRTALVAALSGAATEALSGADEIAVVSAVLAFADRPVREVMIPRTTIVALPEGMPAAEAAHVCAQAGYSRYPVYRGSLDDVIGVAHAFDLLRLQPEDPVPVRPVRAVPGTTRAADLMFEMQRGLGHLAMVLDEFGGTAGMVTHEDLLKNLVGEIFGQHDTSAPPDATPVRLVELGGNEPVDRLQEAFGITVDGRDAQTVGGLLVHTLGRIPHPGERFVIRGLEFDILAATSTRVERVVVRPGAVRPVTLDRTEERS